MEAFGVDNNNFDSVYRTRMDSKLFLSMMSISIMFKIFLFETKNWRK
uniref:Uncharacterized protein n=1 Tax=Lepeophtheirus salmonis TaxID=72036 RepID=A0A0K2V4I7_LEPSM